jgi:hypothetical protein
MLDPRIYRTGFIAVALAVIVFAFSLESQPGGLSTTLSAEAFNGPGVYSTIQSLTKQYPDRHPGSSGDDALAGHVAQVLAARGYSTSTDTFTASTADGSRTLETVSGVRAGLSNGTIVIVSHRDAESSPAAADLSGTAVMLELARVLQGETLNHTVMLVSTSGSVGAAGATRLAGQLAGHPVDAVIVLGDLAGAHATQPVIGPWSNSQAIAPLVLRNTLAAALRGQSGLRPGGNSAGAQLARLAFPLTITEQGPFGARGEPAVLLSVAGQRGPRADEPVSAGRVAALGRTALVSINALDSGSAAAAPASYLLFAGKVVPLWAVRLLVLALMLPVLGATIDGIARARRRGHPIIRWVVWVLSSALPFVLAAGIVRAAKLTGVLDATPPGPVGAGAVPLHGADVALLVVLALVLVLSFWFLRPLCLRLVARFAGPPGTRRGSAGEGAGAALLLVICLAALVIWLANPFAAALMVPALHLWMWVVDPEVRIPRPLAALMILIGLAPPALVVVYYANSLGLSPVDVLWNGALLIAGGQLGLLAAVQWSVVLGCVASVAVIVRRAEHRAGPEQAEAVSVRGPLGYAGPGSLGGTESALRR